MQNKKKKNALSKKLNFRFVLFQTDRQYYNLTSTDNDIGRERPTYNRVGSPARVN